MSYRHEENLRQYGANLADVHATRARQAKGECNFTDPKDERHCWHWNRPHGGKDAERWCCWCGRLGLAVPREKVPGHGPLMIYPGSDANDAEFVA